MRVSGDFLAVYETAKTYLKDQSSCPIDTVVRHENGVWMIESCLEPSDADFEVRLDDFIAYWYNGMISDGYTPSINDINKYKGEE